MGDNGVHILLVTHHYLPEDGAPQRRWASFSQRFIAAGHRVTVLAPPPHYPSGRADGLPTSLLPGSRSFGPHGEVIFRVQFREHGTDLLSRTRDHVRAALSSVTTGIRQFRAREDRPDVVIASAPGIPSVPAGYLLSLYLRVPLVVEMRDAWPDLIVASDIWGGRRRHGWRRLATRVAHEAVTAGQRHAAAVVTTTASFARVLGERRMKRVEVIRNSAPVDRPLLGPPELDRAELRILYLGTLGRSQGLLSAVRAAALLHRSGVNFRLRMIGAGHEEGTILAEAARLGVPVDVLPRVPSTKVAEQYAWADTVLVSLRAWDPFEWTVPSKLYEVLAIGRHVSAAIAGEAAYVVSESGAGDVVPPEDPEALAELWAALAADRTRLRVDDRGRRWVAAQANPDRLAEHYLQLLNEVTP